MKGLYAKAKRGGVKQFTGKDSVFEPPEPREIADLILNTDEQEESASLEQLYRVVQPRVAVPKGEK